MKRPILVWNWVDAIKGIPVDESYILTHGGDEDYVAEVPPEYECEPDWMASGSTFARCDLVIKPHPTKEGWTLAIGGHA